jgi:hypothetical protein
MRSATLIAAITACAVVASTATAQAHDKAKVFCTVLHFKDLKQAEYTFVPYDKDTFAEVKYGMNGAALTHRSDRLPLWSYDIHNGRLSSLTYNMDSRYALLLMEGTGDDFSKTAFVMNAVLMKEGQRIAMGACVFTRPAATTGDSF